MYLRAEKCQKHYEFTIFKSTRNFRGNKFNVNVRNSFWILIVFWYLQLCSWIQTTSRRWIICFCFGTGAINRPNGAKNVSYTTNLYPLIFYGYIVMLLLFSWILFYYVIISNTQLQNIINLHNVFTYKIDVRNTLYKMEIH